MDTGCLSICLVRSSWISFCFLLSLSVYKPFFKDMFLIDFRESGRAGGGEREHQYKKHQSAALVMFYWFNCPVQSFLYPGGSNPKPGYVHWLGIELVTFRYTGRCSTKWATPPGQCTSLAVQNNDIFPPSWTLPPSKSFRNIQFRKILIIKIKNIFVPFLF